MGFICSSHFAIILVPVSRDSKIWSALGVPYERAVLYHTFAGHLAFTTLVLHALLFVVYWIWTEGWDHAVRQSIHAPAEKHHHGLDIPMGWMAFMCAIPMWITSLNYVRRRFYSLFKLAHFLFIGVFVFAAMHVSFVDRTVFPPLVFRFPPKGPPKGVWKSVHKPRVGIILVGGLHTSPVLQV